MRQVKCEDPIEGFLTKGRIYTVIGTRPEEGRLVLIDDRGLEGWFKEQRFSPIHTPKGSPDFSQMQHIADEVKVTHREITCPVIEAAKLRVQVDPTLGPDEWHLVFGDYRNLDNGLAQKRAWGGGSNMTSTFVVIRKGIIDQIKHEFRNAVREQYMQHQDRYGDRPHREPSCYPQADLLDAIIDKLTVSKRGAQ